MLFRIIKLYLWCSDPSGKKRKENQLKSEIDELKELIREQNSVMKDLLEERKKYIAGAVVRDRIARRKAVPRREVVLPIQEEVSEFFEVGN